MGSRARVALPARAVFLFELRHRQLARVAARRGRVGGLRLGARNPVSAVDDRPLLVDRCVLRSVVACLHQQGGARHPCPPAAERADHRGDVLYPVPTALHLRAAALDGSCRRAVRRIVEL